MGTLARPQDNVLGSTDDVPAAMSVSSSVLEPIVITDTQARFVLENKGILSRDSVLQFQLTAEDALKGFLPTSAGIFGLIKQATLRIGARRISDVKDYGMYKTMAHAYDSPSFRNNKTRILKGINTAYVPTPVASNAVSAGQFIPAGSQVAGEGDVFQDYQGILTNSMDTTPCWSIKLAELFPILYDIEIPLFLLQEEVAIDLTFNTQAATDKMVGGVGSLCCFEKVAGSAGPPVVTGEKLGACKLVKESCLLYLDCIYYENERMEREAERVNASQGMFLDYSDLIQNVSNLPFNSAVQALSTDLFSSSKIDQIPVSGFQVKNLMWGYNVADWTTYHAGVAVPPTTNKFYNEWYGKYALVAFRKDDTFQMRVNDLLQFPEPVTSSTHKAAEAESTFGAPVWLNQGVWSYNPVVTKSGLYPVDVKASLFPPAYGGGVGEMKVWGSHMDMQKYVQGQQSFNSINLSNSWGDSNNDAILINQKPIEVLHTGLSVSPTDNYNRTTYYFANVVKRFGIQGGKAVVFQGPAVATPV